MMELVNVKYLIEKIGLHRSSCKKLLVKRLVAKETIKASHYYDKKQVDKLIKEYFISLEPKKENEWDIKDITDHFGLSRSYLQILVNYKNFPKPVRRVVSNRGRYNRVWQDKDIKNLDLKKCVSDKRKKRVIETKPSAKNLNILDIEKQFLRGFRL